MYHCVSPLLCLAVLSCLVLSCCILLHVSTRLYPWTPHLWLTDPGLPLTLCNSPTLTSALGQQLFYYLQSRPWLIVPSTIRTSPTLTSASITTALTSPTPTRLPRSTHSPDVPPWLWVALLPIPTSVPESRLVCREHIVTKLS
ncbi:hypothetical protein FKM82_004953 [Ascaphus truei]